VVANRDGVEFDSPVPNLKEKSAYKTLKKARTNKKCPPPRVLSFVLCIVLWMTYNMVFFHPLRQAQSLTQSMWESGPL
jgi:hypothetical protein